MNAFDDVLYRAMARHKKHAIPARTSSCLAPDPAITRGIATIKIVTEEQIQAIAFGALDSEPEVIVRLDPIGRDVVDLIPFATFMADTIDRAAANGSTFRFWVPHSVTLEALDILGHRYWKNQTAPTEIVRMGEMCRIVAHEAMFPGQQIVADATKLLQDHVVTGLSPIEEGHLGALLAWLDPSVRDPLVEARERIRLPASGILPNTPDHHYDDRIDRLRKERKAASGSRRIALENEMTEILRDSVVREWQLLVDARKSFFELGLSSVGLDELVKDSTERTRYALDNGHFPARRPDRLAVMLGQLEASQEKAELAALENDPALRQLSLHAGAIVAGIISDVRQPKPRYSPCDIEVDSDQSVIRFRLDDKVGVIGSNVCGVVRHLALTPTGSTRICIQITSGYRQTEILRVGSRVELVRQSYGFANVRAFNIVHERQPWVFYGDTPPTLSISGSCDRSVLEIASEARRP